MKHHQIQPDKKRDRENPEDRRPKGSGGVYHIEAIQGAYRRIDGKWRAMQYRLMLWLAAVASVVEILMYFFLPKFGSVTATPGGYLLKYVLAPAGGNLLLCAAATAAMHSGHLTERQKTYALSLLMAVMAFVVYTIHSFFSALFITFTIPMILTVLYGDLLLTSLTGLLCMAGKVVSDLLLHWDPDRPHVFSTGDRAANFWLSLLLLALFYGVCCFLIQIEREKHGVSIGLERERQHYQEEAMTDALTRVWNRQALRQAFQCMERETEESAWFLAMMDLDDFKSLNDNFGHSQGDHYLKTLGEVLQAVAADRVTPFRFGGDEFCVLFCGCTQEEVQSACLEIQGRFREEALRQNFQTVSISIGVAEHRGGERPTRLLDRADRALYQAKRNKGSLCFEP